MSCKELFIKIGKDLKTASVLLDAAGIKRGVSDTVYKTASRIALTSAVLSANEEVTKLKNELNKQINSQLGNLLPKKKGRNTPYALVVSGVDMKTGTIADIFSVGSPTVLNSVELKKDLHSLNLEGAEIVLSKEEAEILETVNNAVVKVFASSFYKDNRNNATNTALESNPAMNFINKKNTTLNVQAAIASGVYNFISTELNKLQEPNTAEDISEMRGVPVEELTPQDYVALSTGSTVSYTAYSIGNHIASKLGIRQAKNIDEDVYNSMVTGFGIIAISAMAEMGIIEKLTPDSKEADGTGWYTTQMSFTENGEEAVKDITVQTIKIDPGFAKERAITEFDNARVIEGLVGVDDEGSIMPSFEKPDPNRSVRVRKQPYASSPQTLVEAVKVLEATPLTFNDGMDELINTVGEDWYNNMTLLQSMGYPEVYINELSSDPQRHLIDVKQSKNQQESDKGAMLGVSTRVRNFVNFYNEWKANDNKEFYYNWFVARNLRLNIGNTGVNGQADKYLARWLISNPNGKSEQSVSAIKSVLSNNYDVNSNDPAIRNALGFIFAMGQGLDSKGLDNKPVNQEKTKPRETIKSISTAMAEVKLAILNNDTDKLKNIIVKASHPGQAALAIANMRKYMEAQSDTGSGSFMSTMLREQDGKTNGYSHKVMQMPLGDWEYVAKATGVIPAGTEVVDKDTGNVVEATSVIDLSASKTSGDIYQKLAKALSVKFADVFNGLPEAVRAALHKAGASVVSKELYKENTTIDTDILANSSEADIDPELRSFVKPSAQETMYGAFAFNSARKRARDKVEEYLNKLARLEGQELTDFVNDTLLNLISVNIDKIPEDGVVVHDSVKESNLGEESTLVMNALGLAGIISLYSAPVGVTTNIQVGNGRYFILNKVNNYGAVVIRNKLRNGLFTSSGNKPLFNSLLPVFEKVFAAPMQEAIDDTFGEYEKLNNTINNAMAFSHDVFMYMYNKSIDDALAAGEKITKEKRNSIVRGLSFLLVGISTSETTSIADRVIIPKDGVSVKTVKVNKFSRDVETKLELSHNVSGNKLSGEGARKGHSYVAAVMAPTINGPAASTMAITTHGHDSARMANTVLNTVKSTGEGNTVLAVFDALTIPDNHHTAIEEANKEHYIGNRNYNMLESVNNMFTTSLTFIKNYRESVVADTTIDDYIKASTIKQIDNMLNKKYGVFTGKKADEKNENSENLTTNLNAFLTTVNANRAELYGRETIVSQFVDPSGNTYKASNEELSALAKADKDKLDTINERLKAFLANVVKDNGIIDKLTEACK